MQFEFDLETHANGVLEVENLGECAIKATNDNVENYYLIVKSSMGVASIFQYGPVVQDIEVLPDFVSCTFQKVDYSDFVIDKIITKFLNDRTKKIKYAEEIPQEQALMECRDLIEYMKGDYR